MQDDISPYVDICFFAQSGLKWIFHHKKWHVIILDRMTSKLVFIFIFGWTCSEVDVFFVKKCMSCYVV